MVRERLAKSGMSFVHVGGGRKAESNGASAGRDRGELDRDERDLQGPTGRGRGRQTE